MQSVAKPSPRGVIMGIQSHAGCLCKAAVIRGCIDLGKLNLSSILSASLEHCGLHTLDVKHHLCLLPVKARYDLGLLLKFAVEPMQKVLKDHAPALVVFFLLRLSSGRVFSLLHLL